MPIAIISVDSVNSHLIDFKDLTSSYDLVYVSTNPQAIELYTKLQIIGIVVNKVVFSDLIDLPTNNDTEFNTRLKFQSVVDSCTGGIASIIISHHSVINTWKAGFIKDEWMVL